MKIHRVAHALRHSSPQERTKAMAALSRVADLWALHSLRAALSDEKDPTAHKAASRAVAACENLLVTRILKRIPGLQKGSANTQQAIIAALSSPKANVRIAAVRSIAMAKNVGAIEMLMRLAKKDKDPDVIIVCLKALGMMGSKREAFFILSFSNHQEKHVRSAALLALTMIGKSFTWSLVVGLAASARNHLARESLSFLTSCGEEHLSRLLSSMLSSADARAAISAMECIALLGDSPYMLLLGPTLNHHKDQVRHKAREIVTRLAMSGVQAAHQLLASSPSKTTPPLSTVPTGAKKGPVAISVPAPPPLPPDMAAPASLDEQLGIMGAQPQTPFAAGDAAVPVPPSLAAPRRVRPPSKVAPTAVAFATLAATTAQAEPTPSGIINAESLKSSQILNYPWLGAGSEGAELQSNDLYDLDNSFSDGSAPRAPVDIPPSPIEPMVGEPRSYAPKAEEKKAAEARAKEFLADAEMSPLTDSCISVSLKDAKKRIMSQTSELKMPAVKIQGGEESTTFDQMLAAGALFSGLLLYGGICSIYVAALYFIHVAVRRGSAADPLWMGVPIAVIILTSYIVWPKGKRLCWTWLPRKSHDKFHRTASSAAQRMGAKPINDAIVVPDGTIDVLTLTSIPLLPLASGDVIAVGALVLEYLSTHELKVLLGRAFALRRVRGSFSRWYLTAFMQDLEGMGRVYAGALSPIGWYIAILKRLFTSSLAPSLRREALEADQHAAEGYGTNIFAETLTSYIVVSRIQERFLQNFISDGSRKSARVKNIYSAVAKANVRRFEKEEKRVHDELMNATTGIFDTSPCLTDRLDAVEGGEPRRTNVRRPAWTLFDGREDIEKAMSEELWQSVGA